MQTFRALSAVRRPGRLASFAVLGAFVLLGLGVGPARASVTLPGGTAPLDGSTFQGGDGDQDGVPTDIPPRLDWQEFQQFQQPDPRRVVHSPDTGSQFGPGSKEDSPGDWVLEDEGAGVDPAKDNVFDAWSAVDQPGPNTFLYLGFTREKAVGTTTIAFELNQDARTWDNDNNPNTPAIPCRRTGDVMVVFDVHGNDAAMEVHLESWVTDTTNSANGCATTGRLTAVATTRIPVAQYGQGSSNPGPITSRLPGHFPIGTQIPEARLFGEAALDLTTLFGNELGDSCFAFGSIWMHSRSSLTETSRMKDYVAPQPLVLNSCAAAGTKFYDLNADGRRDDGEPGLAGFLIWADYDNDGVRDASEPFTETDEHGDYVLKEIRPPAGTGAYTLRETLVSRAAARASDTAWTCSHPGAGTPPDGFDNGVGGLFACGWGPIAASTPFARDRDFGNWLPAQLTVVKQLSPADDPGRFDLHVNAVTVFPRAGDGDSWSDELRPGTYNVSETAAQGTNANDHTSTVTCQLNPSKRGQPRAGTVYPPIALKAGDRATCTFINVRKGAPAIAIEKDGPLVATAGDTLHYSFYVTNPGGVPLGASSVDVTDDTCDQPPKLVSKDDSDGQDDTPATLDPGDTWTYACSHKTSAHTGDCTVSTVTNTATATGDANGTTLRRQDKHTTTLNCPDEQPQPPLPTPTPPNPNPPTPTPTPTPPDTAGSSVPAGPTPPPAGQIGVAGLSVGGGCVARPSQVRLRGTRFGLIRVAVDGHRVNVVRPRISQRSVAPLPRLSGPGRHRLTVHVSFQHGSSSPPVTLSRTLTTCGQPHFTG